jgi:hypothetical protein
MLLLFIGVYSYGQDTPNAFADRINHIFQYVDKKPNTYGHIAGVRYRFYQCK